MKLKELEKYQKGSEDDYFSEKIYRKFSIIFSLLFIKLGFSANLITFLSLILDIMAGIIFFLSNNYFWVLFAAFLTQLSFILDCSDGEVARYNREKKKIKNPKKYGWYLDETLGIIGFIVIFMSIGWHAFFISGNWKILLLLFFAVFGFLMINETAALSKIIFSEEKKAIAKNTREKIKSLFSRFGININKRLFAFSADMQRMSIFIGSLINYPLLILWVFAFIGNFYWLIKFWVYRKK